MAHRVNLDCGLAETTKTKIMLAEFIAAMAAIMLNER
jgi:hypothetical protein